VKVGLTGREAVPVAATEVVVEVFRNWKIGIGLCTVIFGSECYNFLIFNDDGLISNKQASVVPYVVTEDDIRVNSLRGVDHEIDGISDGHLLPNLVWVLIDILLFAPVPNPMILIRQHFACLFPLQPVLVPQRYPVVPVPIVVNNILMRYFLKIHLFHYVFLIKH
jgi:hypothetical protein